VIARGGGGLGVVRGLDRGVAVGVTATRGDGDGRWVLSGDGEAPEAGLGLLAVGLGLPAGDGLGKRLSGARPQAASKTTRPAARIPTFAPPTPEWPTFADESLCGS
jgi:hypothetical protein